MEVEVGWALGPFLVPVHPILRAQSQDPPAPEQSSGIPQSWKRAWGAWRGPGVCMSCQAPETPAARPRVRSELGGLSRRRAGVVAEGRTPWGSGRGRRALDGTCRGLVILCGRAALGAKLLGWGWHLVSGLST